MAGRPKGSLNKKTLDLFDLCSKERIDPFRELLKLCKDGDPQIKLTALKEVCRYLYPVRKAIEVTGEDGGPIKTENQSRFELETIEQFKELVKLKYAAKGS